MHLRHVLKLFFGLDDVTVSSPFETDIAYKCSVPLTQDQKAGSLPLDHKCSPRTKFHKTPSTGVGQLVLDT